MKNLKKTLLLGSLIILGSAFDSHARLDDRYDPTTYDSSLFEGLEADCNEVCSWFVEEKDSNKNLASRKNKDTESQYGGSAKPIADDQWCANHGETTAYATQPQVLPADKTKANNQPYKRLTTKDGKLVLEDTTCPFPLIGNEACSEVQHKLMQCKLRNTQAKEYCRVYKSGKKASQWQKLLLPLTFTAATTCGTICASQTAFGLGLAAQKACTYAGYSATAAEIAGVVLLKDSYMANAGKVALAAGGGLSARGVSRPTSSTSSSVSTLENQRKQLLQKLSGTSHINPEQYSALQTRIDAMPEGAERTAMQNNLNQLKQTDAKLAEAKGQASTKETIDQNKRKAACFAAATFGALTGIRALGLASANRTRKNACEDIRNLLSQAKVTDSSGGGGGGVTIYPPTPNASGVGGSAQAPRQSGMVGGSGLQASGNSNFQNLGSLPAIAQSSPDVRLLKTGALDKVLSPQASKLNADKLLKDALEGNLGNSIQRSMGGGSGNSSFGSSLSNLANTAVEHGANSGLKGVVPKDIEMAMVSPAGRGSKPSSENSGPNFDALMNEGDSRDPATVGSTEETVESNSSNSVVEGVDQDSSKNLFQKVGNKTKRVDKEQRLGNP